MFSIDNDYTAINLEFNYLNLKKYLFKMFEKGITDINLLLLISLEKEYYEGENLKRIIVDLVKLSNNIVLNIDGKDIKFKVNKISLDVGDVLNRHRWIYRYNEKYMLEHNLKDGEEDKIPEEIKQEIQARAYETGKQQGFDWFKNHTIDALNLVLPENKQLNKDFKLTNGITQIFEGNETLPPIEYICYEYWLKHQRYERVAKALDEVRNLPYSVVEKTYNHEANYYVERLNNRNENPKMPNIFIRYSKDYLVDETIKDTLIQQIGNNNLEFYYLGLEPKYNIVFRGKRARNNNIIQNSINNELFGVDDTHWITIRKKEFQNEDTRF